MIFILNFVFKLTKKILLISCITFASLSSIATFSASAAALLGNLMGAVGITTVSSSMSANAKRLIDSNTKLKASNSKLIKTNNDYKERLLKVRKTSAGIAKRSAKFFVGKVAPVIGTGLIVAETGIIIDDTCGIVDLTNDIADSDDNFSQACAGYIKEKKTFKTKWNKFSDNVENGWKDFSDKAEAWYKSW